MHKILGQDFVLQGEYETNHITLEDALSHRTGMPRHDFVWINKNISVQDSTRSMRHLPASTELRTKWQYCNMMYRAVSHAVQTVTGKALGNVFKDWLWEPLGMNETYFGLQDAFSSQNGNAKCKLARSYDFNNETGTFEELSWDTLPEADGAGGVISNVEDYAKWVRALMYENGPV